MVLELHILPVVNNCLDTTTLIARTANKLQAMLGTSLCDRIKNEDNRLKMKVTDTIKTISSYKWS